jgi:hypothetical protein
MESIAGEISKRAITVEVTNNIGNANAAFDKFVISALAKLRRCLDGGRPKRVGIIIDK